MSLKVKISFVVGIMILLSMATTMAIISAQVKTSSQKLNFAIAEEMAKHIASEITLVLEKAMTTARLMDIGFRHAKQDKAPRESLDGVLIEAIHQNQRIFGTWTLWEPNAYDNADSKYINSELHDHTGRVNSYWHWHQGEVIHEVNVGWEDSSWYTVPKQNGTTTLEDPYFYEVSNEPKLLISTIQPIMLDGEFLGVAGVDLELNFLQQMLEEVKVQDMGYAELIAHNGMYLAHPNQDLISKLATGEITQSVQDGKMIQEIFYSSHLNEQAFRIQVPILVEDTDTPWALVINVPMRVINSSGKEVEKLILTISVVSGLVMLILIWLFVTKGMAPLVLITDKIRETTDKKEGLLNKVPETSKGEVGTLAHAFNNMVDALNESRQNLIAINNELEERVAARTEQLEEALSRQKAIQNQLIETEKMASLGNLVAGVAHEINTPIGVALTGASHLRESTENLRTKQRAQALRRTDFDEYVESSMEMCTIIENNIQRATSLITNFKMVAVDRSHEEERIVQLDEYIATILASLQPNFKKYDVSLEVDIESNISACCDPGSLAHIFSNTIMNSFFHAFKDENQTDKNIKVSCKLINGHVELIIGDNGVGMSEKVKEKVFEPFYTTQRGKGGSGLGMHITYNMVTHKLNGHISVESELGKGTVTKVVFPKIHPSRACSG